MLDLFVAFDKSMDCCMGLVSVISLYANAPDGSIEISTASDSFWASLSGFSGRRFLSKLTLTHCPL